MLLQQSETCSDPALSVVVMPREAAGGWLKQQGGEYHLLLFSTATCLHAVRLPYTLDNTLSNRLLEHQ